MSDRDRARVLVLAVPRHFNARVDATWATIWSNAVFMLHGKAEAFLANERNNGETLLDEIQLVSLMLDHIEHDVRMRSRIPVADKRGWTIHELAADLRAHGIDLNGGADS